MPDRKKAAFLKKIDKAAKKKSGVKRKKKEKLVSTRKPNSVIKADRGVELWQSVIRVPTDVIESLREHVEIHNATAGRGDKISLNMLITHVLTEWTYKHRPGEHEFIKDK